MKDIKELALRVAEEVGIKATFVCGKPDECPDDDGCCHHSVPDGRWLKQGKLEKFATRLIAAYCEGREPVASMNRGCAYPIKAGNGFHELPDGTRLFTAPPEPAPDWLLKTAQNLALHMAKEFFPDVPQFEVMDDLAGVISQIDNMVCGLPREPITACAAPSSDEVRETVARLNDRFYDLDEGDCRRISDLIERLAARVPDGCVVVGYLDGRGRFFYADDPHMEIDHTGMREVFAAGDVK